MLTERQKVLRRNGIGGSDVAAIFGISPYKNRTPYTLYLEKVEGIEPEISPEWQDELNYRSMMELSLAKIYTLKTGKETSPDGTIYYAKDFPWMFANIDRMVEDGTILEIKTSKYKTGWGQPGTDEIPYQYLLQVAHYCFVLDKPKCDLIVQFGNFEFQIYTYERNKALEVKLVEGCRDFWINHVQKKIPPEYTERDDLDKLYKTVKGKLAEANHDILQMIEEYKLLQAQEKEITDKKETLKNKVKLYMEDADKLVYQGQVLASLSSFETNRLNTDLLKKKFPTAHQQCCVPSVSKRFSVKA